MAYVLETSLARLEEPRFDSGVGSHPNRKVDMNAPNLDAMDIDDLWLFWTDHAHGQGFRAIFPNGGKGTRNAVRDLANYAANIATAKKLRIDGKVEAAREYERIADEIYDNLPPFARW